MAVAVAVSYPDPSRFPPLLRLSAGVQRPDVRRVMGRAIATKLRQHFTKLDGERSNKLGGKRTHFYGNARRAVQQPELFGGDGVKVAINHVGIAQRYFGGEIKPGPGKEWLTIPARAETHGRRAGEFDDLHFERYRSDLAALVQNAQTRLGGRVDGSVTERGATGETGGGIFYWLVKEVYQKEDPTVLPPEEELQDAGLNAGEDYVKTLIERTQS